MRIEARWWACAAAALGVAFVLLLAPIGLGATRLANAIEDAAHGPLFAAIAVGVLLSLRKVRPHTASLQLYVLAWAIAVLIGVVTEAAQTLTGNRLATLRDLISDAIGAFAGLAVFALFDTRLRLHAVNKLVMLSLSAVALAIVFMPALDAMLELRQRRAQLPALLTWDTPLGYRSLVAYDASGMMASVPVEWRRYERERAFYLYPFKPAPNGLQDEARSWPGVAVDEPWPIWSAYRALSVDIVNPNDEELSLTLRVNDWVHNHSYTDRFNRILRIPSRQRLQIDIPIADIAAGPQARVMDIDDIAKLILFQEGRIGALPFYLCGIRLVP